MRFMGYEQMALPLLGFLSTATPYYALLLHTTTNSSTAMPLTDGFEMFLDYGQLIFLHTFCSECSSNLYY